MMAMNSDIEALVLSGELFNGGASRSSSPRRSPSPDSGWHDEHLLDDEEDQGYDSDAARRNAFNEKEKEAQKESIGMGPGRTGVKGVIRDRDEAEGLGRAQKAREADEKRAHWARGDLGGKTYLEEERQKAYMNSLTGLEEKIDRLVFAENGDKDKERAGEWDGERGRMDVFGRPREGRFGHLREVGVNGFVGAVEREERGVWVVLHLYEPSLDRCYLLDDTLSRLARLYPDTKFLRSRASALGFASTNSSSSSRSGAPKPTPRTKTTIRTSKSSRLIDDDDPYADLDEDDADVAEDDGDDGDGEGDRDADDDNVDLDMLPTMLVYRDGELVYNWVRVDWEAGRAGIEELLDKHHVLARESVLGIGNCGLPLDDEEGEGDLMWSDGEGPL